jgi:hypothetical protein
MESSSTAYRLRVRVGNSEFDAEGPEELVKSQFELFLQAVNAAPASQQKTSTTSVSGKSDSENDVAFAAQKDLIERAYMDDGDRISLRVLPTGNNVNSETLILLLFGFHAMKQQYDVSAIDLTAAARKSGLHVERIDRCVPTEFVGKGGRAKGTRYSLNNRGIARAQELLEEMF